MGIEKKVDSHVVVKKREKGKVGRMTGVGLDLANGRVKWVRVKKRVVLNGLQAITLTWSFKVRVKTELTLIFTHEKIYIYI